MKYISESSIYWNYDNVKTLAKKNVRESRKIIKKNKEGILEILNQGVSEAKIKNLSETDKELMAALYFLIYRENDDKNINNLSNKNFLEELFDKGLEEVVEDKDTFLKNIKKIIVDPRRFSAWKGEEEKTSDDTSKKKKPEETKTEAPKEEEKKTPPPKKEKKKAKDPAPEVPVETETPTEKPPLTTSDAEEKSFSDATRELESVKNDAIQKLNSALESPEISHGAKVQITSIIDSITKDYEKRIKTIKKAEAGLTMNPKLRIQQELISGKSFIERALLSARAARMPGAIERLGTAGKDVGKAFGRIKDSFIDAAKNSFPGRIAGQVINDKRAREVYEALGKKLMEKYVYSNSKEEKNEILDMAKKSKTAEKTVEKAKEDKKEEPLTQSQKDAEQERRIKKYMKTKAQQDDEKKAAAGKEEKIVSSTDVSHLKSINEQVKELVKGNIKEIKKSPLC